MKIQCDVCNRDEASIFCGADEAALCAACDRRVHHANKLAVKHQRFSLLRCRPNKDRDDDERQPLPLCDVCQELRAFLFCQQDRAILCHDCDLAIHAVNQRTANHSRFVLTGAVLSSTPIITSSNDDSTSSSAMNHHRREQPTPEIITDPPETETETENETDTSATISEYLMAMLPGWRVEDFLDFPNYTPYGFCENDGCSSQFLDADLEGSFGFWGPEAPPPPPAPPQALLGIKDSKNSSSLKTNRRPREDAFTVPQFRPPSTASNRSRNSAFSDLA